MNTRLEEAQYQVVHEFPGGCVKLAELAGMNAGTLANKVNPGMATHKLAVAEAITLQTIAKDYRILYAEASALNHVAIALGDYAALSDVELLNAYAKLHQEIGDVAREIAKAFADRKLSAAEFSRITDEMDQTVRAMFELRARLKAVVDG